MKLNGVNEFGYTRLMLLAEGGQVNELIQIIDKGIDIDAQNQDGETALGIAIKKGNREIAEVLINHGADINLADFDCNTPLILASEKDGCHNTVDLLIKKGADINQGNNLGETALHKACYYGLYEIAKLLISNCADVNIQDIYGETPLHKTAYYGWTDIGGLVISAGVDLNIANNSGEKPVEIAAANGWKELTQLLLSKGATTDKEVLVKNIFDFNVSNSVDKEDILVAARNYYELIKTLDA